MATGDRDEVRKAVRRVIRAKIEAGEKLAQLTRAYIEDPTPENESAIWAHLDKHFKETP